MWIFPQDDPAVRVELRLDVSRGESVVFHTGNGAPEPQMTRGTDGSDTYLWVMENVARLGTPHINDPAVAEPYAAWSTWRDWETLGALISTSFNQAAVLSQAMADTLKGRLAHEPTPAAKARAIAGLVDEFVGNIRYDTRFWRFSPRPASRTWDTAYGHSLDRAALAAALYRDAGFKAELVYRTAAPGEIDIDVPGLSRFHDVVEKFHGVDPQVQFGAFYAEVGIVDVVRRVFQAKKPEDPFDGIIQPDFECLDKLFSCFLDFLPGNILIIRFEALRVVEGQKFREYPGFD